MSIGTHDPVVKRAKFDAAASGKTGSPSGVRQSETRRDGRFLFTLKQRGLSGTHERTRNPHQLCLLRLKKEGISGDRPEMP
ncbi:hypothetical protein ACFSE1_15535 [Rhizobium helianthi]|uniref:Uncharacterized protein n=1 Tax=Rhizobium helianthi TaxID=1132695 RepID=A0ABW4M629_9HYPH